MENQNANVSKQKQLELINAATTQYFKDYFSHLILLSGKGTEREQINSFTIKHTDKRGYELVIKGREWDPKTGVRDVVCYESADSLVECIRLLRSMCANSGFRWQTDQYPAKPRDINILGRVDGETQYDYE